MADFVASVSSRVKLNLIPSSHFRSPKSVCFGDRNLSQGSCKVVNFPHRRAHSIGLSFSKEGPYIKETSLRCSCLGSLVDPDGVTASELVAISDQLLLVASIALTYMAGILPVNRSNFSLANIFDDNVVPESAATSSGSAKKNDDHVSSYNAWDAVKAKLMDSLDTIEHGNNLGNRSLEIEKQAKRPLSLYAVSEGPKLRLLWASFKQLKDEVNSVLANGNTPNLDDWLTIFPDTIRKSYSRVCIAWLLEELRLENKNLDEAIVSLMIQKLKGDETVLRNIRKSGKEDLYAELLYFLRFGSLRKSCSYGQSLFSLHGDSILEDLVINLADGVASVYLELISVDGNLSNEMNDLGMFMCNLSTRALQRLRNEVSLNQWLYQNVDAVVSMYEDRYDLCTLQSIIIEEPSNSQTEENLSWWKRLTQGQRVTLRSSFSYFVISQFSVPVKRTKELRALTGWRYYFSLCIELSDITMPLIKAVIDKVSSAISFFLVSLIGRSLGLIYTGIRQSLRWK